LQENRTYFLLFHTIHDVLKAENALKKHSFNFELVPIPRNLSSDCGSCIKLKDHIEDVNPYIEDIELDRCFVFDGKEYKEVNRMGMW